MNRKSLDFLVNKVLDSKRKVVYYLNKNERNILNINKKYKDMLKNDRCFILGNGPSLNLYDLSVLKNEFVICVNEFYMYDKFYDVMPNAYILADPAYFTLNKNNKEDRIFIDNIKNIIDKKIDLWIPLLFRKKVNEYGWRGRIKYYNNCLIWEEERNNKIVFDKRVPQMQAVIHYAILLANYMGVSEIYMLGVEQTDIFSSISTFIDRQGDFEYAFHLSDDSKNWKKNQLMRYSLSGLLYGYARIFELYDELFDYCCKNNVKIYNCSPQSLIKSIPYKMWNDIF